MSRFSKSNLISWVWTSQVADRGAHRSRRIIISAASILGAKGINLLVVLFATPLTYNYLGQEKFGLLMVVLSMIMLMNFADLGLGYGLFNKIALYDVNEDMDGLKRAISSTFFFLVGMGILMFTLFSFLSYFISWGDVFNVGSIDIKKEADQAMFVFAACFCITLPFTLVMRVQLGYQENHINQAWEGSGNVLSLLALLIAIKLKCGVPIIVLAQYGSQCLFTILNFGYQFLIKRPHLLPLVRHWNMTTFKEIFMDARMIFTLQVSTIILNAIDSVLISRFWSPAAVGIYAMGYRLYSIFILPVQAFLNSLLPGFNDAMASQDMGWITRKARITVLSVLSVSVLLFVLYVCTANLILSVWISNTASMHFGLLMAFGVFIVYQNISSLLFNIMFSPVFLRQLFRLFTITALVVVVLKVVLIQYFDYSSVIWATIAGATILFIIPGYSFLVNQFRQMARATL